MITITTGDITSMLVYVATLFEDFKPLIFLIVGLYLGFWVIGKIISITTYDKRMDEWFEDETDSVKRPRL